MDNDPIIASLPRKDSVTSCRKRNMYGDQHFKVDVLESNTNSGKEYLKLWYFLLILFISLHFLSIYLVVCTYTCYQITS